MQRKRLCAFLYSAHFALAFGYYHSVHTAVSQSGEILKALPFSARDIVAQNVLAKLNTISFVGFMSAFKNEANLLEEAKRCIDRGEVFVANDWISSLEVQNIRTDIANMVSNDQINFAPSGLTNRAKTNETFGTKDRLVHPVSYDDLDASPTLAKIKDKVDTLRRDISKAMNRPSMSFDSLRHELYLSLGRPGAILPRHLDERHEETKGGAVLALFTIDSFIERTSIGKLGWSSPSRRSISWLLYLCPPLWDTAMNGGALRTFPQKRVVTNGPCGSHEGNLQVGWLAGQDDKHVVEPVFMDAWRKHSDLTEGSLSPSTTAKCAMYVRNKSWFSPRRYISIDFESRDPITGKIRTSWEPFLMDSAKKRFWRIEDLDAWERGEDPAGSEVRDVAPTGGSLVLFDSVSLPHQVLETLAGERLAVAGWFHEQHQPFPSWYSGA